MSRISDGATTRRERILDMLSYIYRAGDRGLPISQVQGHMSITHGLTYRKTHEYIYEQQMNGLLFFEAGRVKIKQDQFLRLLELQGLENKINLEDLDSRLR